MKPAYPIFALTVLSVALTSCAGGQSGPHFEPGAINHALAIAPGGAQPSTIVATEVAYRQAAEARGFLAASSDYAAGGAKIHGRSGLFALPAGGNEGDLYGAPAAWGPRTVVMSCDGALALSVGRFLDQNGLIGTYVTTWERQKANDYKWSYNVSGLDDPQPPPRADFDDSESLITVTAIDSIYGLVASCPRAGSPIPPPPAISIANDYPGAAQLSKDGTLRWRWESRPDGTKSIIAEYFYEGAWETAFEEELASPS